MTERVDFYVLAAAAPRLRSTFACRLIAKAYLMDLSVVVWLDEPSAAKAVDDLLWTFDDRSFVPHRLCGEGAAMDPGTPVHLTAELDSVERADLLINLSDRLPAGLDRFMRIAEIIDADPERRRLGRERFKTYREHKLALETHQLGETAEI